MMPQTTLLQTTQSQSNCAGCPKFKDYQDRGRGLCRVFDRVVRKHHQLTNDCQSALESEQLHCHQITTKSSKGNASFADQIN